MLKNIFYIYILLASTSCSSFKRSPKYQLTNGIYQSSFFTRQGDRVYVETHEDTILAFAAKKKNKDYSVDRVKPLKTFTKIKSDIVPSKYTFYKPSFDIDFLTIPFKYRPEASGFPRQLNSTLNGALYLGSRYDLFKIDYDKTPLGSEERDINHLGFSLGILAGLGSTEMNPWVTNDAVNSEYNGIVFSKGLATVVGFNRFSAGLAIGADNLLDKNQKFWIYQNKLWIGLAFGFNLN